MPKPYRLLLFLLLLIAGVVPCRAAEVLPGDSTKHQITSLDSLSPEDLALLDEYKDSFDIELQDFKDLLKVYRKKQIDTSVAQIDHSSHAEIGLDFASRLLSNGRSSGLKGVAFYPSAMYYHKWGFYAALGLGFMTDSAIRHSAPVPLMFISPGFSRLFFNKWQLNIGYTRGILFYGTSLEKGILNNTITFYNSFDFWHYIELAASMQASWSSDKRSRFLAERYSVGVGLWLKHDFRFFNFIGSKVFTLTPELYFLFGHDNGTFLVRRLAGEQYGRPVVLQHDLFFGFLDVEPALTADWRIRNLDIYAGFHLAIPFSEFDDDTKTRVKNPKHYYPYAQAGIKYVFMIKKKRKK